MVLAGDLKMAQPPWELSVLTCVAKVLADTADGLTGSEIGELLGRLGMEDPGAGITKWRRLQEAFVRRQNRDGHPQRIITFITRGPELFTLRQDRLNEALTFVSLRVNDKGQVAKGAHSTTLDEASRNATSLRPERSTRPVPPPPATTNWRANCGPGLPNWWGCRTTTDPTGRPAISPVLSPVSGRCRRRCPTSYASSRSDRRRLRY